MLTTSNKSYYLFLLLMLSLGLSSCGSKNNNETQKEEKTIQTVELEPEVVKADTITIDYTTHKDLLTILENLPENYGMQDLQWSQKERKELVDFIKEKDFVIDSTQYYKAIKPHTISIKTGEIAWTIAIYKSSINDIFFVTKETVNDSSLIQTFVSSHDEIMPTKMINYFETSLEKLLVESTDSCYKLLEDNYSTFSYDFREKDLVKITSSVLKKEDVENCLKGNTIHFKTTDLGKPTFVVDTIYWSDNQ